MFLPLRKWWLTRPYATQLYRAYCHGVISARQFYIRAVFTPRWSVKV